MDLLKAKKLFSKPKEDPQFAEKQFKIRQVLLKNLSRAVKETQLLFTRTETDVLNDSRPVQRLCARFEDTLRHGLKTGWFAAGKQPTFWPVVLKISRKQAIEFINRLQYAQTENGKCRAWIRLAVNECSLESYINVLCQDKQLLNYYYEPYSFLRDEDVVSPLCQLLTGLSQIHFNITVDTASLEFAPAPEALEPALRLRAPQPVEGKKEGVSSASTPQASSSGSSWPSSADSSLTSNTTGQSITPSDQRTIGHQLPSNFEIIRDKHGDLEASVHVEDDALVIDAVFERKAPTSVAYTDLSRFSQALEEEAESEDWLNKDSENTTGSMDQLEKIGRKSMERENLSTSLRNGGISSSLKDGSNLVSSLPHDTPPLHSPMSSNESLGAAYETPPISPSTSPPPFVKESREFSPSWTREPENGPLPSNDENLLSATPPQATLPQFTPQILPLQATPPQATPPQATSPNENVVKEEKEEEEYSFGDILRMATGLPPVNEKKDEREEESNEEKITEEQEEELEQQQETREDEKVVTLTQSLGEEEKTLSDIVETLQEQQENSQEFNNVTDDVMTTPLTTPTFHPTNPFYNEIAAPPTTGTNPFVDDHIGLVPDESSLTTPTNFPDGNLPTNPFDDLWLSPRDGPAPSNPFLAITPEVRRKECETIEEVPKPRIGAIEEVGNEEEKEMNETRRREEKRERETERSTRRDRQAYDQRKKESELVKSVNKGPFEKDYVMLDMSLQLSEDPSLFDVEEEHYTEEMSIGQIEYQVAKLKSHLRRDSSDIKLQQKLIHLQLLKQEMKEMMESKQSDLVVCGHLLVMLPKGISAKKCDTCNKPAVGLLRQIMKCQSCGYLTHVKCSSQITQKCLSLAMKEQSMYSMDICPERGLTPQYFRCACCNQALNNSTEVRLCDYTGQYYCPECHHNDMSIIPARVLHNWDFSLRRVCCSCFKLLDVLSVRPLINVQSINPSLYTYVHDIGAIEALRNDILLMKDLLVNCERAKKEKLMQELNLWPHFKDTSNLFSLSDLIEIQDGRLLSQLQAVHKIYLSHICNECEKCLNRGTPCRICESRDVLFSFSKEVTFCSTCRTLYHKECFNSGKKPCPVCVERRRSRPIASDRTNKFN